MSDRKFLLAKGPFIRRSDFGKLNTKTMMMDIIIALIPLMIFAWVKNGILPLASHIDGTNFYTMIRPLLFIIIGSGSAYLFEALYYLFFIKTEKIDNKEVKINPFVKAWNTYGIIPGMMLSMILPLNTPLWVLLIGTFFAIWIGKMIFGGFGYNLFNPALVGYIFVMTAFYGVISKNGGYLNPSETIDIVSGATPLADFKNVLSGAESLDSVINAHGSLLKFFLGVRSGSLAETSGLLIVLAYAYLVIKKVIDWKMPLTYVGTVFILSYIIGAFTGYATTLNYALFNIFNGGVLFAAVFMVTEPVTNPRNDYAKLIYAVFIGILTITLRFLSDMPEGASTAILFMNMFTPLLDLSFAKLRVEDSIKKRIIGYGIYVFIAVAITLFIILRLTIK